MSLYGEEVHRGHAALTQYIVAETAERAKLQEQGEGFVQFHQLYWTASRRRADGSIHIAFIGRLVDEFRLRDGKWLLQRRQVPRDP